MPERAIRALIAPAAIVIAWALIACSPRSEAPRPAADASATAPTTESEDFKTFELGELSATALRDGALELPNDNKVFGVGRTPEEVAAVLSAANLPTDKLHLNVQPLLVRASDRVLLFDTGAGTNMGPTAGRLAASMAAAGVDPQSITDVFISHSHGDHVGGLLNAQGAAAFPNAAIHMSAPEWAFLKGNPQYSEFAPVIAPKIAEFAPGAEIIPGVVKAVEIRGHTPGHSGYLITSGQSSLLYVGDTVHHFVVSVQRPDWTIAFDNDPTTAEASRVDVLTRNAASGQRIYAVHFPFPGLGKIERREDKFVWIAE
jgi:glyoxylase-like metal-dependent hydrolase (beta-lactamase superfamily II)